MIRYEHFKYKDRNKDHPITYSCSSNEIKKLSEEIQLTLKKWEVEYADKVIIAYDNDLLIGFFRYDLGDVRPWLYAAGTYIIPEYRNRNIAFELWNRAITLEKPTQILAHIASDGGFKLINKVKKQYPKILFNLSMDKKVSAA